MMFGENKFTLFIGYKDPQYDESFSFYKYRKEFNYTRYRGKDLPSVCNGFGLGPNTSVHLRKIEIIETNFNSETKN